MSQEATPVTDVSSPSDSDANADLTTPETELQAHDDSPEPDGGPGASEGGFAIRFGSGFAVGMLAGGLVGVFLNSLALAMFGGFILGSVLGVVLAARA